MNDLERIKAEKKIYNDNGLKRKKYLRILSHAGVFYNKHQRDLLKKIMVPAAEGTALELGSTSWKSFFYDTGITPESLTCINISERELEKGKENAKLFSMNIDFFIMDAHHLLFEDSKFDCVFGAGILHHLNFEAAIKEIKRVLKPNGFAVFIEPLDNNPMGKLVRRLTPKARTRHEEPLRIKHLNQCKKYMNLELFFMQFISVPLGVLSFLLGMQKENFLTRAGYYIDQKLLDFFPFLGYYYRQSILLMHPIKSKTHLKKTKK